jgi:hypothetical protein
MQTLKSAFQTLIENGKTGTDAKRVQKFATDAALDYCTPLAVIAPETVATMTNQKAILRLAQALNFIASGDVKALDPVIALAVLLVMRDKGGDDAQRCEFSQIHFAFSGHAREGTKPLPGIASPTIRKFLGRLGASTVTSQTSRTTGKNGLFTVMGATVRDSHGFTVANPAHPFIGAYAARLAKMPEGELIDRLSINRESLPVLPE